jgi:predicted DNA-binding protein
MKTSDIFKINRSSRRLNESLQKTFGKKLNLESFDLDQLQDARNKLRTQVSQVRNEAGFNENLENEAFTQAQWMLDAINSEIAEREEFILAADSTEVQEGFGSLEDEVAQILKKFDGDMNEIGGYGDPDQDKIVELLKQGDVEAALDIVYSSYADQDGGELRDMDVYIQDLEDDFEELAQGGDEDEGGDTDDSYALASAGHGSDEDYGDFGRDESFDAETNEAYINSAKDAINILADLRKQSKMAERGQGEPVRPNQLVNDLWDVITWIEANMEESIATESTQGDNMRKVTEGEIQQASAIVTAKTMVDRVGRWIEELSGMENDTLLQLGDSIRDEMGSEQAKQFISAVAPAIQAALENLKTTRETLATGVRTLTGEEQGAEMLGAEPEEGGLGDMAEPAAPDEMNMPAEEPAADEFGAADAATGGAETAGREQRESIQYQNRLLKVLAG